MDDLPVLREHADHVTFRHLVWKAPEKYTGRVFIFLMPRIFGPGNSHFQLSIVHFELVISLCFRIHL